jgi:TPR repeat protein
MKKFITTSLLLLCLCINQKARAGCKWEKTLIKKTVTTHGSPNNQKTYNSNLERYLDLARTGDKQGTYAAANAYYKGEEPPINYSYAISYFSKAPDYYDSAYKIATMFRAGGYGINKSPNDAVKWFAYYFKINAQEGHNAAYQIGEMYELGEINGTPDIKNAIKWYKKAAEKNNPRATAKVEKLDKSWFSKLFD